MSARNEAVVGAEDDLSDGEMKVVRVGETEVLLARLDGEYYAVGATCTHYGGPLVEGVLHGDHVMCPWHHACFRITTGQRMEPPALDPLPRYQVRREGGSVIVRLSEVAELDTQPETASTNGLPDPRVFVILGGGAAGLAAAQHLREAEFGGRIVLITRENRLPYDRPNLSKDYLAGTADPAWMPLRGDEFYDQQRIEVLRNHEVVRVDPTARDLQFSDGSVLRYDALLLASGGTPRRLQLPGADLGKIFLLRSFDDADAIIEAVEKDQSAVVIGSGFVGMEAAASLTARGMHVTVVTRDDVPFEAVLGTQVGQMFRALHEENGVSFRVGQSIARVEGNDTVEAVVLEDGERVPAHLVVAGLGITPATSYLHGVTRQDDGGIEVDNAMQVQDGLYAAGDIARFPAAPTLRPARIEHWRVAEQLGRAAADGMLGEKLHAIVPFFWTTQFGQSLNYVGHAEEWDQIIFWGDPASREFIAFYARGGLIAAAAGMGRDRDIAAIEELMRGDRMPSAQTIHAGEIDLLTLVRNG